MRVKVSTYVAVRCVEHEPIELEIYDPAGQDTGALIPPIGGPVRGLGLGLG